MQLEYNANIRKKKDAVQRRRLLTTDSVITGTVEEVVPKMIKYYKQNSK